MRELIVEGPATHIQCRQERDDTRFNEGTRKETQAGQIHCPAASRNDVGPRLGESHDDLRI